jgi:hypothetical protein
MNRRDFLKGAVMMGVGAEADAAGGARAGRPSEFSAADIRFCACDWPAVGV